MKIISSLSQWPALRAIFVMGAGSAARLLSGLAKVKISAAMLGPAGVGTLGLAGQAQLLGLTWGSLSLGAGFMQKYTAALATGDTEKRKDILATTFSLLFFANLLIIGLALAAWPWLGTNIFGSSALSICLLPVAFTVPFQVMVGAYFQGILFAHGKYDLWARSCSVIAVPELLLFAAGAWFYGTLGALAGLALGMLFWAAWLLRECLKLEKAKDLFRLKLNKEVARSLASSSLAMSLTSSAAYLSGVLIRIYLMRSFGADTNGAYQAACLISGMYLQFVTNGIWVQLFPAACRPGEKEKLHGAWNESLWVTASLGAICQSALLLFPALLTMHLFGREFSATADFLRLQLLGDFFFVIAQPSLAVLLARGRLREYALVWLAFYLVQTAAPFALMPYFGASSVNVAYLLASFSLAAVSAFYYARQRTAGRAPMLLQLGLLGAGVTLAFAFSRGLADGPGLAIRLFAFAGVLVVSLAGMAALGTNGINGGLKTRALNRLRKLLQYGPVEASLAGWFARGTRPFWQFKLLPNHYQYPKPSRRRVARGGISYELDIADFLDWHIYFGLVEGPKEKLYSLSRPGDTVIDVGANIGETAMSLAARVGADGRVIAFEPDPAMNEKCLTNFRLNSFPNLELERLALADSEAEHRLACVSERNPAGNRIQPPGAVAEENSVAVKAVRLDDYLTAKGISRVSLIKIDVEGFEHNVLRGAKETILRSQPKLFIELNDQNLREQGTSPGALLADLRSWNYQVYRADTGEALLESSCLENIHFDIVCLPS